MIIDSMIPVYGIPLCNETNCSKKIQILKHTKDKLIVESDSYTPDPPYGDHFSVKELWVILSPPGRMGADGWPVH